MHKKFKINWKKMKGGCQLGRKVVTHDSNSDLPLVRLICITKYFSIVYSGEEATSSECGSRNAVFYCSKKSDKYHLFEGNFVFLLSGTVYCLFYLFFSFWYKTHRAQVSSLIVVNSLSTLQTIESNRCMFL